MLLMTSFDPKRPAIQQQLGFVPLARASWMGGQGVSA